MLKYLLGFALIFSLAVYVAVQDEHAANQAAQETEKRSYLAVPAKPDANHAQQNIANSERNLPSWYGFFRWPNGTTTWAILLTLLAIAEQTKQIAKSTSATQRASDLMDKSIILQFRPKLIVRKVHLEYGSSAINGKPARIHYTIANVGGVNAGIVKKCGIVGFADVPEFTGEPPKSARCAPPSFSQPFEMPVSIPLAAGEDREFTLDLTQAMFDKIGQIQMTTYMGRRKGVISICAEIQYSDDTKTLRKTGIRRTLDFDTWRFNPDRESEDEYAD